MNIIPIIADLITQLESNIKNYFDLISKPENFSNEDIMNEINDISQRAKVLFSVINQEIQKCK